MNIKILPPDVNESFSDFTVVRDDNGTITNKIRFGLHSIKNFGEEIARVIVDERKKNGKFTSLSNFLERIIFAPHNFNYHQEHHDFPGIPYYQLPEFYKSKINNKKHKKIQHSYLSMLFAILFGIRLKN